MKPLISLSLFLFTTLKLVAGQDNIMTEYQKLWNLCEGGGPKTVSRNMVKMYKFTTLLFSMLVSGMLGTITSPTTMGFAIRIQSMEVVNWLRWPYSANPQHATTIRKFLLLLLFK